MTPPLVHDPQGLLSTAPLKPFAEPADQLRAELFRIGLELDRQVVRRRVAGRHVGDPAYRGLYVPDELVDALVSPPEAEPADREVLARYDVLVSQERATVATRAASSADDVLRLPALARRFDLDPLDVDILLLAIAPELDARVPTLLSWLQDDAALRRPTAALVADLWTDRVTARSRLDPGAPLRAGGLISLSDGGGAVPAVLVDQALIPAERIVAHLLGDDRPDPLLRDCLHGYAAGVAEVALSDLAVAPPVPSLLDRARQLVAEGLAGVVVLTGPPGCGRRTAVLALAAALGRPYLVLGPAVAPTTLTVTDLLDLAIREARLGGAALVVPDADQVIREENSASVVGRFAALAALGVPVLLTSTGSWHHAADRGADWFEVEFTEPDFARRRELWRRTLQAAGARADPDAVAPVADAFRFGPAQMVAAVRRAARTAEGEIGHGELAAAARSVSSHSLGRFARLVRTPHTWADLVLPGPTRRQIDELRAAIRHRARVQTEWGFSDQRGLHVLFSGPSGTGKTMSAALIAGELGLDLYAVELASVVSKYIGETEKNLEAVFAEGRASNAVLLFDEADALFGKRSEVKDAHDRYSNLEVAYLLQRIEGYDGITILATNLRANLDDAFARRLAFTIEFPAPDARLRARIWHVAIPADAPVAAEVDVEFLATQVELTGAGIRNAALSAAYLAAGDGTAIGMEHLVRGVTRELQKTGRTPSRAAFGEYFAVLADLITTDGASPQP
jgi:MoxR-like ATPase